MAAALRILGPLTLGDKPPLSQADEVVQQKVLMAMYCVTGAIA